MSTPVMHCLWQKTASPEVRLLVCSRLMRGDDTGVCTRPSDVASAENTPAILSGSRLPEWVPADAEEPTRPRVRPAASRSATLPRDADGPRNPRRPI